MKPSGTFGQRGEALVCEKLKKQNCQILATNYHSRFGEIDIVARDGEEIVFVEVKSRRTDEYGSPQESMTPAKWKKMTTTAQSYLLQTRQEYDPYRFDLFTVEMDKAGIVRIEQFKNIFP